MSVIFRNDTDDVKNDLQSGDMCLQLHFFISRTIFTCRHIFSFSFEFYFNLIEQPAILGKTFLNFMNLSEHLMYYFTRNLFSKDAYFMKLNLKMTVLSLVYN